MIGEAVQLTETHFARFWVPEVYRVKGELLSAQASQGHTDTGPETAAAVACWQQARAIARQQGAKALELRAATSLSRLWLAQDQPEAAQGLLAELYGGFTEGLDTADLQAAQGLLARCHSVASGVCPQHLLEDVPATIQERAWILPMWYTPGS